MKSVELPRLFNCIGIFVFACLLLPVSPLCAGQPTPDSAISWDFKADPKWTVGNNSLTQFGFITEFVRKGDSVEAWKELFEQQIVFSALPLRKSVDNWRATMLKADPKIELKEETIADDFIFMTYTSQSAEETGLRGFLRGKDAVYMIAYMVRPKFKNEETLKIWEKIIRNAKLVPNPEKKRQADATKP